MDIYPNKMLQSQYDSMDEYIRPKTKLGCKGYRFVKHPYYDKPNKSIINWDDLKVGERGKFTFLDQITSDAKKNPRPNTRSLVDNWQVESQKIFIHGHPHKLKFSKTKKESMTDEIIRKETSKNSPSPG